MPAAQRFSREMAMLKKFLLALLALVTVDAQASTPGSWDVGAQAITYPVIGANGVFTEHLGDGSNAHGGLPPVFALQPPDIPSTINNQITEGTGVGQSTGTDEGKVRFTLFGSHALPDDLLRNHCTRGASHLHEFVGSVNAGACSTYAQIRNDAVARHNAGQVATTNPGDDINASPYWHPCLIDRNPLGDGVDRCKKLFAIPLYYQIPDGGCSGNNACLLGRAQTFIDFPLGLGFISGNNMDDPFNLRVINAIAAANAANVAAGGTNNRYSYIGNGFVGWFCMSPAGVVGVDGTQPDIAKLDCSAGDTLVGEIHGEGCIDGQNLYSPSGYDHVMPPIRVTAANGTFDDVCPYNWYKIPQLIFKPEWILKSAISSTVANDEPYLSSDAQFQAKMRTFAGHSTDVCLPGCSFHNDYMVSWQLKYLRRAFRKCLGIPQTNTSETGVDADQTVNLMACNNGTLSPNSILTGTNQVQFPDVNGDRIQEYYPTPVPKGRMGPATMPNN